MITEEQINQHLADIDEYFAAEDYDSIFKTAKALYEETDGRYSYFLGACYNRGWGTEYDEEKALYYMENAANNDDNYFYASCGRNGQARWW